MAHRSNLGVLTLLHVSHSITSHIVRYRLLGQGLEKHTELTLGCRTGHTEVLHSVLCHPGQAKGGGCTPGLTVATSFTRLYFLCVKEQAAMTRLYQRLAQL